MAMANDRVHPRKRKKVCSFCVDKVAHIDFKDMDFGQFRIHRNRDEAAVACAVTGQKILPVEIGRASCRERV